jgi:transcription-repair coupling factor (superfamily II helicase)
MARSKSAARLQPDHKLLFKADWATPAARLAGVRWLVRELAQIAAMRRAA